LINGNTNITTATNGNANVTIGGTSNVVVFTTGGIDVTGTVSANGTVTGGNIATGGTVSSTGTATLGNVNTGGVISATGTITSANTISGVDISATGNVNANGNVTGVTFVGNVAATTVSATGNVTSGNVLTGGLISATGNVNAGNAIATSGKFGNIVISGDDITDAGGGVVNINSALADVNFAVNGDTVANLLFVDAGTDTISIGSNVQTTGAVLAINATNSILFPVGNTAQRPTGTVGMLRYNTTVDSLEQYTSTGWDTVGSPVFTVITDNQFNGDGSTVAFTLTQAATTAGTIVAINGVQQIPTTAYAISGTTLTFTEAPAAGDVIDVRMFTTTASVTSISNASGNAVVAASETAAQVNVTGDLSVSGSILGGNINSTAITSGTSNMAIVSSGGNIRGNVAGTTVMTISPGLVDIQGNLTVSGNATLQGNILGDRIQNGTTSFDIQSASGNANITIGGTSNVAVFTTSGVNVTGTVSANGTVTGGNIATGGTVSATGNITSGGDLSLTGNIVDGGALTVSTSSNGNITLSPNGSGVIVVNKDIVNGQGNGVGNIGSATTYFNTIFAKATSAQYADLAEKYEADAEYAPGTVLAFGGDKEVTLSTEAGSTRVAGVVSTNPSYIMNAGLTAEHVAMVALQGRVPCRVVGPVAKGDMMVAAGNGAARVDNSARAGSIIGKALENFDGAEGTIEVVIGRN
jgi:filamentous hemagglutinin